MLPLACDKTGRPARLGGHEILRTALIVSAVTMGLDQFLRTPSASFTGQPGIQAQHWITDSLMAVPLFAAACWIGDLAASHTGFDAGKSSERVKRPLIISLFGVLFLAPVWFAINKTVTPAAVHPHVAPHASDTGDVYAVPSAVIIALVCVCLVPAGFLLGRVIASLAVRTRGRAAVSARRWSGVAVPLLLAAAMPALAWLLYRASHHAYASQVYYAGFQAAVERHATATTPAAHLVAAPFAVGYQIAHALQDGLAGQAAGFPAAALALVIPAHRPLPDHNGRQSQPTAHEEAPE